MEKGFQRNPPIRRIPLNPLFIPISYSLFKDSSIIYPFRLISYVPLLLELSFILKKGVYIYYHWFFHFSSAAYVHILPAQDLQMGVSHFVSLIFMALETFSFRTYFRLQFERDSTDYDLKMHFLILLFC